jgi:hypothetical protein
VSDALRPTPPTESGPEPPPATPEPHTVAAPGPQPEPPAAGAHCRNCGVLLHGPFCSECGQAVKPLDPPVRHFAKEFAQELLDVDGRVPRSFRSLFFSPGFITHEYLAGRRVPWLTPLRLYLIASVAMFGVLASIGDQGGVRLTFTGERSEIEQSVRSFGFANEAEMRAAIDAARFTWMPRVMFLLVPWFAALVALVRRSAARRFPAHFVFALEVHAAAFGLQALTKAIAAVSPGLVGRLLDSATDAYILGYIFIALRTVYGGTRSRAALHTAVIAVGYTAALIASTGAVVAATVFGRNWVNRLGS